MRNLKPKSSFMLYSFIHICLASILRRGSFSKSSCKLKHRVPTKQRKDPEELISDSGSATYQLHESGQSFLINGIGMKLLSHRTAKDPMIQCIGMSLPESQEHNRHSADVDESGGHKMQQNKVLLPISLQALKYGEERRNDGWTEGRKDGRKERRIGYKEGRREEVRGDGWERNVGKEGGGKIRKGNKNTYLGCYHCNYVDKEQGSFKVTHSLTILILDYKG